MNKHTKTKLAKVAEAVFAVSGNQLSKFQAVEIAEALLKKTNGNLDESIRLASSPYRIDGQLSW